MPSESHNLEFPCITLSDSQESSDDTAASKVYEYESENRNQISSEEAPLPQNEDIVTTTQLSLSALPDDDEILSNIDESETHVLHNEAEINNTCIHMHPAVSSGDFDRVVHLKAERDLADSEKFYLLNHHFVPGINYQFPAHTFGKQSRRFQRNWLTKYNGLAYSQNADGGYCKYCVLFAQCEASSQAFGILVNQPLTNFKKASNILIKHFGCKGRKSHQIAVEKAKAFCNVMTNQAVSIDQQLSSQRAQIVANNRLKLRSIAATIIFCGKQAISLRGHRDDWSTLENNDASNTLGGNFQALLQFRIDSGDQILKEHLRTAQNNAIYTSKTIQNDIIYICGDLLRNKILKKVREAHFFSVIADEATDVANDEQLSISIRYVEDGIPQEKFLGFHECQTGVSGEAIAGDILEQLANWQLEPRLLRGQAYDGAGAMAGQIKGTAARIASLYPKAIYTHCASHRLNLCVVKCCSIREVNNMMQIADKVARFFKYSPKRQLALEAWIDDLFPEEKRKKVKEMCRTRWVERHEAFDVFCDLFLPIVCCLEKISMSSYSEWNNETRSDSQTMLLALSQFSFIVTLTATQNVLAYTKGLSVKLQGRYVDIARAYHEITNLKTTLQKIRSDVNSFHARIYSEAMVIAQSVGVEESMPRLAGRQQHRQNIQAQNSNDYFRLNLTIPLLDHLINEINSRFDNTSSQATIEFVNLLPSTINASHSVISRDDLKSILQLYEDDLPSLLSFNAELDLWIQHWKVESELACNLNTPGKTLQYTDKDFYPNINVLLRIMATIPVTSCECERSISLLRLIKTSLRSSMGQDRLNGLAMLHCHQNIELTPEEVVQEFALRNPRRMRL